MKKLFYFVFILIIISCVVKQKGTDGKKGEHGIKAKSVSVSTIDIKKNMEYLCSNELGGRATGSKGIEKAAIYIENYLKKNNIKPYFKTYRDSFKLQEIIGYNIVGVIDGNDPDLKNEFVILGGHYDHIGKAKEVNGDTIANGANDDASGTVAAIELGRYFSKSKTNKRSILITLYSAEEIGLKGSEHLAQRLKKDSLDVYTMINFEMVGVPRNPEEIMAYMSGYNRSNFATTLNRYAGEKILGLFPKAEQFKLFYRSDNYPFYEAFKIPAHAISTFDFTNFDYYHHVDDEADQMDYSHMTQFITKMIPALEGMINSPTKEVVLTQDE